MEHSSLEAYFKEKKAHIYGCWEEGKVPLRIIKNYKLSQEHLHKLDWERLKEAGKQDGKVQSTVQQHVDPKSPDGSEKSGQGVKNPPADTASGKAN